MTQDNTYNGASCELTANDIIDVRDIIARVEELENEVADTEAQAWANRDEYAALTAILDELEGQGGDEQWRGNWYPTTLIRESYFTDYTQEMLEDCGTIPRDLPHWVHIDWDATAREVMVDYSTVEIDGVTYFYR